MIEEFDSEIYSYTGEYMGWWRIGYNVETNEYMILFPLKEIPCTL